MSLAKEIKDFLDNPLRARFRAVVGTPFGVKGIVEEEARQEGEEECLVCRPQLGFPFPQDEGSLVFPGQPLEVDCLENQDIPTFQAHRFVRVEKTSNGLWVPFAIVLRDNEGKDGVAFPVLLQAGRYYYLQCPAPLLSDKEIMDASLFYPLLPGDRIFVSHPFSVSTPWGEWKFGRFWSDYLRGPRLAALEGLGVTYLQPKGTKVEAA